MREQGDFNLDLGKHPSAENPHVFSKDENMQLTPQLKLLLYRVRNTQPQPPKINRRRGERGLGSNWRS